jgi:hypothetical protein
MDNRKFSCKNEELPVIGGYLSYSLKRDLVSFTGLSPKFNEDYVLLFDERINVCSSLVDAKEETSELKLITQRLYGSFGQATEMMNVLTFYIKQAKNAIPIPLSDFGIQLLRDRISRKDAEGILQNLHIVISQTQHYQNTLLEQGMPDTFVEQLHLLHAAIANDNQKQYETLRRRRELVENNTNTLNDLYAQILEICEAGKLLFRGKEPVKLQEYTFSELLKRVRTVYHRPEKKKEQ